ncbi:zinc ribbon domain-containing protein [Longicatena caecimuris]|uniref:zinc ribbon domain-containing protein n=1 Tax=Longicatena caecimuris TaxID=1796635 RepID=UPI0018AB0BF4|nr:zinc ribbon domain-containing protein [Longicatena caecimuris]
MNDFKFCMHCGAKLPNEAKFCMECGKPTGIIDEEINIEEKLSNKLNDPSLSDIDVSNIKVILATEGYSKGVKENRTRQLRENNVISYNEYNEIMNYISNSTTSVSSSPKTTEQIIAEAKATHSDVVRCPKCGSTSIVASNKKLSVKRAVVGTMLLNPIGGAIGAVTSKKMYNICQNCGHRWKI